jgi:starch synthase
MTSPLSVLFLASEAEPFVKVGGLGDVAGSLPRALRAQGVDIRLAIPLHGSIKPSKYDLHLQATFTVLHRSGPMPVEVYATELDGLPVYLISGPPFRPDSPVYSNDWGFDAHKYIFFSLAALELARTLNWQLDILHGNDWHTAAAVYWLALHRPSDRFYGQTSSVLTVHNLPYMGTAGGVPLGAFGLPPDSKSHLPEWARHLPLPLGLLTADYIAAVSPTYAREILTPEFGSGLHEFLRTRADTITGILNGLDQDLWNPAWDAAVKSPYDPKDLSPRELNKINLQQELALPTDTAIPLLAFIGRLNQQKGLDLILEALRSLVDSPWQIVFLGSGDPPLEDAIRQFQLEYPERARAAIRYDATLSHHIYAGADALLVPSRYEPCGLVQMIAMRYGCVPIARATGGLKDTVFETSGGPANGFVFDDATPVALAEAVRRALDLYSDRPRWQDLQRQGMQQDFSWERSAREYSLLYQKLMKERHL